MNINTLTPEAAMATLCAAAEFVIADGIDHARTDDPHRLARLHTEFDGGKARRRLVLDYEAGGRVRVSLQLDGTTGGESKLVEVFSTLVQGPVADATH